MEPTTLGERKFISFHDQIARNKQFSYLLFIFIFLVFIALGWIIAQIYSEFAFFILFFAVVFSVLYTWFTYENSADIVLKAVNAYPAQGEKFSHLRNMVEGLSLAAGLQMPKVYIMPSKDLNAFATGKDPEHSVVCVTEGLLEKMSDSELEGVLAHEMTHIQNYDIRFVTLVAIMVGIIAIVSEIFLRSLRYGGGGGRGGGKVKALLFVIAIIFAILAPIIVKLVQFAISRKREFAADAGAVQLTRYPGGLMSALEKIKNYYYAGKAKTHVNEAVAPLFFADPIKERLINLFNTHPPIDERIKILKAM